VGDSEASLAAEVNPQSEVGEKATEYYFQYGICAQASDCVASGYEASAPVPDGQIPASFVGQSVGVRLTGLQPHTTYHFRVLARNAQSVNGEYEPGEAQTFTTEATGGELVLPDNRGYELVSPPDKQGASIEPLAEAGVVQAAASGDAITYLANAPTEAELAGFTNHEQILSRRGTSSWSSRDIGIPHTAATGLTGGQGAEFKFFDPELMLAAVQPFGQFDPELSDEASGSTAYLADLSEGCSGNCYSPLVTGKPGFANVPENINFGENELCKPKATGTGEAKVVCGPEFLGATEDLSHVVLSSKVPLTAGAVPGELYEWSAGSLAPVSVLPGGAGVTGTLGLLSSALNLRGAISNDGNRVVWSTPSGLFLRDMAREETVQLDLAEEVTPGKPCVGCVNGGGNFQVASSDGSRVFFTDINRLTEDAGTAGTGELYECRIVLTPKLTCQLSDLTPVRGSESAEVQFGPSTKPGVIPGAGEAGEQVYFVANGVQSGSNSEGKSPVAGKPNLYVHQAGSTELIATLETADKHDWAEDLVNQPTRVSPNGRFLEFMSQAKLLGYDNETGFGKPAAEVYIYDATSKRLRCASCMPSGVRPVGAEYEGLESGHGGLVGAYNMWETKGLVAANVPGWSVDSVLGHQPRYLSNEGRLFFDSADALVPQDSNGTQDVYEYEPPGIGSCSEPSETFSARNGGCVSLISSGSSTQESAFLDASAKGPNGAEGEDVFFLTSAQLSPLDVDASVDVYDAHVCSSASPCIAYGGVQSPPCTTEASCKASPTPQPSIFGAPSSATFQGPGNLTPAAAVKAKAKPLTRAQKLVKALKACHTKKSKRKRQACEKQARRRYGPVKRAKKKARK
jgi:hypothetical protein